MRNVLDLFEIIASTCAHVWYITNSIQLHLRFDFEIQSDIASSLASATILNAA